MLKKLYTLIIIVLVISMIVAGWISFSKLDELNVKKNEEKLQTVINYTFNKIENGMDYDLINTSIKSVFNYENESIRITFILPDGTVLYDNEADALLMDNHRYRPEVYKALNTNDYEYSIRKSDTLNSDIYYMAYFRQDLNLLVRASLSLSDYQSNIREVLMGLIWVLATGLTILIIVGTIAVKQITRPIKEIGKAALNYSSGKYSQRVYINEKNNDEITNLAQSFNFMAEELERVIKEQERKNEMLDTVLNSVGSCIVQANSNFEITFFNKAAKEEFLDKSYDLNEKYNLISIIRSNVLFEMVKESFESNEKKSIQTNIETKKGNKLFKILISPIPGKNDTEAIITLHDVTEVNKLQKLRSDFVANVTHELKTPLTSIRGFIETLKEGAVNNPEVSGKFLDIIDVEAARLHKLITDILIISDLENQESSDEIEQFDLNELIDETIVLLDEEADKKKVTITAMTKEEGCEEFLVNANKGKIKQVLINLTQNAIRYNNEGGKVHIDALRNEKNEVEICVFDTGNGIAKEHLPRLFERFYRADKGRSRDIGSTGLGLSIVKHIAMLYNGSVDVKSEIGKGSCFKITLKI